METIEVWRGQSTTDTDGNPIQGKPARVGTFQAMVAPTSTTDQTEENASPQTIEYTIHIRGSQPTGIQATDLIKVRGILLPVKGKPQVWNNLHGRHIGDVITDPEKVRKFVCVDTNDAPEVAVVDPDMMASMPAGLTASTGMDALTHAIEGYTTKGAWELSDMFHFEAIKLISENLRDSVAEAKSGQPGSGREGMALGQYVAGMGFSNVGLGIDHAMAHTLSAHYDTPHGVACAMLLPIAMEFNKPVCAERLAKVAVAMGVDTTGMSTDEAADAAIAAVKQLSADVNIPHVCEAMKADEIEVLAKDAMADACFPGNPREATLDDVIELFKKICPAA